MDNRIHQVLDIEAHRIRADDSALEETVARVARRSTKNHVTALVVSLAIAVAGIALVVVAFPTISQDATPARAGARVVDQVDVGGAPRHVAIGARHVWITTNRPMTDQQEVVGIERDTGTVAASFTIDGADDLAADQRFVWVAGFVESEAAVFRIDPVSRDVTVTHLGPHPIADVMSDGNSVWISVPQTRDGGPGRLVRVDPATGNVTATAQMEGEVGATRLAEGSVWALISPSHAEGPASLVEIDAVSGQIVRDMDTAGSSSSLVLDQEWAWLTSYTELGAAVRVDTRSGASDTVQVGTDTFIPVGVDEGRLWFFGPANKGTPLHAIDVTSRQPLGAVTVLDAFPQDAVLDLPGKAIWTADLDGTSTRIQISD